MTTSAGCDAERAARGSRAASPVRRCSDREAPAGRSARRARAPPGRAASRHGRDVRRHCAQARTSRRRRPARGRGRARTACTRGHAEPTRMLAHQRASLSRCPGLRARPHVALASPRARRLRVRRVCRRVSHPALAAQAVRNQHRQRVSREERRRAAADPRRIVP